MQLANIEGRKQALLDALLDRLIEKETYEARHTELLTQAIELQERSQNQANIADAGENIRRIRELFKNLYFTYSFANSSEKRQLIKILYANRMVDGKKLTLEPQKWVLDLSASLTFLFGPPTSATTRSGSELHGDVIQNVNDLLNCPELQVFLEFGDARNRKPDHLNKSE